MILKNIFNNLYWIVIAANQPSASNHDLNVAKPNPELAMSSESNAESDNEKVCSEVTSFLLSMIGK